jgi:nondiscriminating glutamyl-tRNA synthetase
VPRIDDSRPLRAGCSLHAGDTVSAAGARLALFNWLLARRSGGTLVLGIGGAHSAQGVIDEMRWLGLDTLEGPYVRAERDAIYREHAARLVASGRTYESGGATVFRFPGGRTVIDDLVKGRVEFDNAAVGDVTIVTADDCVTDVFATAVDDGLLAIDVCVRDEESIGDTPRLMLLQDALGLRSPRYGHVGAVLDDPPSVRDLRRAGYLPAAVLKHLALVGWTPEHGREDLTLDELVRQFSLERVARTACAFDEARLRVLNARELTALPREALVSMIAESMQAHGFLETPVPDAALRWIHTFVEAYGADIASLGEALSLVADLRAEAVLVPALELEKLRNRQVVFFLDAVGQYVDSQAELRGLPLSHDLPAIAEEFGIEKSDAFAAVRMALTGKHDGAPLNLLFPLLGHDRILIRLGAISSHLLHGRGLEPIKFGPGGVPFETIAAHPPAR